MIAKAKEKLTGTAMALNEIACEPVFEYLQRFSKLCKAKPSSRDLHSGLLLTEHTIVSFAHHVL